MKYLVLLLPAFLCVAKTFSQARPFFIISTTRVYSKPGMSEKAIGVYARGGSAEEIKKLNNNWSQVIVENGDTGFLPSKFLVRSLNARDVYEKDPADFVSPEDTNAAYGNTHLFVTGASVKARAIFVKNKPVIKIFRTNEPVGVSYLPYDENGLVKVGGGYFERKEMAFIPKKFLGKKISFAAALKEFKNTRDAALKKQQAERIYEMSWLESKAGNLVGVQAFRNYAKESGNAMLYEQLAFEELLLQQTQQTIDFKEQLLIFEKYPAVFTIAGKTLPLLFNEKDILQVQLPKTVMEAAAGTYPECGVEITKEYRFDNFKVYHSSTDSLTYIPEVFFRKDDISFSIAGFRIDHQVTEEAFIKKMGGFISYSWLDTPHVYTIPDQDAAAFVFHFKDGKIEKMEYFFYC